MKFNNINFLLLHSLYETDFLFLNNNNTNTQNLKNNKIILELVNPLQTLQNLKQLIRVIQFLKKQKKALLNFFVQNLFQKNIIEKFLTINKSLIPFKTFYRFLTLKKKNEIQFLLSFVNPLYKDLNLFKSLLNKKIFLVHETNRLTKNINVSSYGLHNDIANYKKLIFLLSLIDFTFKKANINK